MPKWSCSGVVFKNRTPSEPGGTPTERFISLFIIWWPLVGSVCSLFIRSTLIKYLQKASLALLSRQSSRTSSLYIRLILLESSPSWIYTWTFHSSPPAPSPEKTRSHSPLVLGLPGQRCVARACLIEINWISATQMGFQFWSLRWSLAVFVLYVTHSILIPALGHLCACWWDPGPFKLSSYPLDSRQLKILF